MKNYHVREEGKIYPWGMLRVCPNDEPDELHKNNCGLIFWSLKLMPYGDDKHFAKIVKSTVEIFLKENNEKVITIPAKHILETADILVTRVREMGYLQSIGVLGSMFDGRNDWSSTLDSLRRVAKGKPALRFDNSAFTQVSMSLIGKNLIKINFGNGLTPKYKVFTFEGSPVRIKVSHPLRFNVNETNNIMHQGIKADQGEYSCSLNITLAAL